MMTTVFTGSQPIRPDKAVSFNRQPHFSGEPEDHNKDQTLVRIEGDVFAGQGGNGLPERAEQLLIQARQQWDTLPRLQKIGIKTLAGALLLPVALNKDVPVALRVTAVLALGTLLVNVGNGLLGDKLRQQIDTIGKPVVLPDTRGLTPLDAVKTQLKALDALLLKLEATPAGQHDADTFLEREIQKLKIRVAQVDLQAKLRQLEPPSNDEPNTRPPSKRRLI